MAFKDNILTLRNKKNLGQKDVAEKLGVRIQQISNYENGRSWVTEENLYKLAELFGVPVWVLFYDSLDENLTSVSGDSTRLKELSLKYHEARDKIEGLESKLARMQAELDKAKASAEDHRKDAEELRRKIADMSAAKAKVKR